MIAVRKRVLLDIAGGEWPELPKKYEGFSWSSVDHYEVENGVLVPYLGGLPMDGPDLKLIAV